MGFFSKNELFGGMKKLWIYYKAGLFGVCMWGGGVNFLHFKAFLKVKVQNANIFGIAKILNIILGMPKFLTFFGVNSRCWVQARDLFLCS